MRPKVLGTLPLLVSFVGSRASFASHGPGTQREVGLQTVDAKLAGRERAYQETLRKGRSTQTFGSSILNNEFLSLLITLLKHF